MQAAGAGRKLHRSRDAHIAGVCAGIAEYYDFDAIAIRVLAVLTALMTLGLITVVYLVLWAVLPRADEPAALYDVTPESAESSAYGYLDWREAAGFPKDGGETGLSIVGRLAIAVGVMLLFLLVSVNVSPLVSGSQWWQFWPVMLIIVGLCLIVVPIRGRFEGLWHALGIMVTSIAATLLPITLGMLSWATLLVAFQDLWPFFVVAAIMLVLGLKRNINALMFAAAFCVAAFCLIALMAYGVPGDTQGPVLEMPEGISLSMMFHL